MFSIIQLNKIKQTDEVNPLNSSMWICRSTLHAKAYLLVVTFLFYLYIWITSTGNWEVSWNWVNNHLNLFANMYTSEFRIHCNINENYTQLQVLINSKNVLTITIQVNWVSHLTTTLLLGSTGQTRVKYPKAQDQQGT